MTGPMPDYLRIAEDTLRQAPMDAGAELARQVFMGYVLFTALVGEAIKAHDELTRSGKTLRLEVFPMRDEYDLLFSSRRVSIKSVPYEHGVKVTYSGDGEFNERVLTASSIAEVMRGSKAEMSVAIHFLLGGRVA